MRSSGHRPILVLVTFLAVAAAALVLFWASSDTRPTQAKDNFDATFTVRNCDVLPPIAPWTGAFPGYAGGIAGTDLHGPGGAGGPDGIADCTPGQDPSVEVLTSNTASDLSERLCLPGRSGVADCPASAFSPNLGAKNFSSVINYIPNGYQLNCKGTCPSPMASDAGLGADLDVGEFVGGGDNSVNLQAATQGQCTSNFNVPFFFYNIALPDNPSNPRASSNIAFPRNEGQPDRFGAWQVGSPPPDGGANNVTDANSDNKADAATLSVQNYPSYLLDEFDPDFVPGVGDNADGGANLPPVVPIAVYGGMTQPVPASTDWTPLYFVQFAPGALKAAGGLWVAPHPLSRTDASLGAPSVAILNDPSAVKASVSAIQDFCSVVRSTTMLLASGGNGHVRYKTPTVGVGGATYFYQNITSSLRDADGDGRENGFDTCPNTADAPPWDSDGDGLNDSCDPDPGVGCTPGPDCNGHKAVSDVDGDGFDNEQDNCPQVSNGLPPVDPTGDGQKESEQTVLSYAAVAPDGGPKTDGIGDACEINNWWQDVFTNGSGTVANDLHLTFEATKPIKRVLTITGGAPGTWDWQIHAHGLNTPTPCDASDNVVDITANGGTTLANGGTLTIVVQTCASQSSLSMTSGQWTFGGGNVGAAFGPVANTNLASPSVANGDFQIRAQVTPKCIGGTDGDKDGYCLGDTDAASCSGSDANAVKHCPWGPPLTGALSGDTDGDTTGPSSDWQETFQGTDATHRCAHTVGAANANDEPLPDRWRFDFNDDGQAGLADILAYVPVYLTTGNPRWDQNQDGSIGLADILSFIPVYLTSCVKQPWD